MAANVCVFALEILQNVKFTLSAMVKMSCQVDCVEKCL